MEASRGNFGCLRAFVRRPLPFYTKNHIHSRSPVSLRALCVLCGYWSCFPIRVISVYQWQDFLLPISSASSASSAVQRCCFCLSDDPMSRRPDGPILLRVPSCPLWLMVFPFPIASHSSHAASSASSASSAVQRFCFCPSDAPIPGASFLNSITSSGHSGQLCFQHTRMCALPTGCPCAT